NGYRPPRPFRRRFERRPPGIDRRRVAYYSAKGGYAYMAGKLAMSEADLSLIRSWYAGAIAYIDSRIGELVRWLKERRLYDDTLILVTADHGENLGEHGLAYHMFSLHDTLLHVPLIASCPSRLPRGRRIAEIVSLTDVTPTVLEVADIEDRAARDGRSLLPFDDRPLHEAVFAEFGRPQYMLKRLAAAFPGHDFSRFDRGLRAVRTKKHKLVVGTDGVEELFDLRSDPAETRNRIAELPDVAAALRLALERWQSANGEIRASSPTEEDDEAVTASLRELGYF
ncbi:MAG: sulfatase family protein, partial [Candidatus Binatia bacterium]